MNIVSAISGGSGDAYKQLVEGLQMEFGCVDVGGLAARILEAEKADFHWEARVAERYLGQYIEFEFSCDELREELSRVAIVSFLADRWHVGVCVIDGEGAPQEMLWCRKFGNCGEAEIAFFEAR